MDKYFVIGHPVKHSLSPEIHKMFAAQFDIEMSYETRDFEPGGFIEGMAVLRREDSPKGANVTHPFKMDAYQYCDEVTPRARKCEAVNTLIFDGNRVLGDTTDGKGFVNDVTQRCGASLTGARVLILGAGGAGRGFSGGARRARKGEDIAYTMSIAFLDAVQGSEQKVILGGKTINVKIPAGSADNQTLRLKGLGQPGFNGGPAGDVLITLKVQPHPYFRAEGQDIHLDLPISLKEAVLGAKVTVPTISGKVAVKIPPYSDSGEKLRLKGKGIKSQTGTGDEIITLKVITSADKNTELEKVLAAMPDKNIRNF